MAARPDHVWRYEGHAEPDGGDAPARARHAAREHLALVRPPLGEASCHGQAWDNTMPNSASTGKRARAVTRFGPQVRAHQ